MDLPPNFVAVIGDEFHEYSIKSVRKDSIAATSAESTAGDVAPTGETNRKGWLFNGMGDFWENTGFKFRSWGDMPTAFRRALHNGPRGGGLELEEVDAQTVQDNHNILVGRTNKRHCLLANMYPRGDRGTTGFLDGTRVLAAAANGSDPELLPPPGQDNCLALDYESKVDPNAKWGLQSTALYDEAISNVPDKDFENPVWTPGLPTQGRALLDTSTGFEDGPGSVHTRLIQGRISVACVHKDGKSIAPCVAAEAIKWGLLDLFDLPGNVALTIKAPLAYVPNALAEKLARHTNFDVREHYAQVSELEEVPMGQGNRRRLRDTCGAGDVGSTVTTFDLTHVSQSKDVGAIIAAGLKRFEKEGAGELLELLQDAQAEEGDKAPTLCGVSVKVTGDLGVPSEQEAWRPSATTSIAPSISLGDGVSATPASTLKIGSRYSVFLSNFPDRSDIVIKLIHSTDSTGPIVINVADFRDRGYAETSYTPAAGDVPKNAAADDSFYLYAFSKQVPALFATSSVFTFKNK